MFCIVLCYVSIYLAVAKSLHSRFLNNSSSRTPFDVIFRQLIDATWNIFVMKFHQKNAVLVRYVFAVCDMRYFLRYDMTFSEKYRKNESFLAKQKCEPSYFVDVYKILNTCTSE